MIARTTRLLTLPLSACVGMLALTGVPSHAASLTRPEPTAKVADAHQKRHPRIKNRRLGIPKPSALSGPAAGQVALTWPKTKGANRYSVLWSSGPYGKWPGPTTYVGAKWLPRSARSAVLDVNGLGAYQLSPAYGNPAFMSLWADNSRDRAPRHKAKYLAVWPQIAAPTAGTHVRVGQYNLEAGGRSSAAEAANIVAQGLGLVAMQETGNGGAGSSVASQAGMSYIGIADEGIAFNPNLVSCTNPQSVGYHSVAATCFAGRKSFTFVSSHFTGANADTGAQAQGVANSIAGIGGVKIIAGDFTSNREPYGSANQAQPVLVRNGYWDAQASLGRIGQEYSTFNGHKTQAPNRSGYGTRADYIMSYGIAGSVQYHNVANGAGNPSDHNLVLAELALP